jgi:hypothetical protein
MRKFAQMQPKDGETVLHCGHIEGTHHFFLLSHEMVFSRPDQTRGSSRWLVLCVACMARHGDNPGAAIRADSVWQGDRPAIMEPEAN